MTCGDELRLVQTVDQMLELLVTSGEAQLKNIGSSHVVPHKMNRGGGMMEVRKVYAKGCNIMGVGFSMARCDPKRAVAFQSKPGDGYDVRRFVDFAHATPRLASPVGWLVASIGAPEVDPRIPSCRRATGYWTR